MNAFDALVIANALKKELGYKRAFTDEHGVLLEFKHLIYGADGNPLGYQRRFNPFVQGPDNDMMRAHYEDDIKNKPTCGPKA
jgi:hypothetical protein